MLGWGCWARAIRAAAHAVWWPLRQAGTSVGVSTYAPSRAADTPAPTAPSDARALRRTHMACGGREPVRLIGPTLPALFHAPPPPARQTVCREVTSELGYPNQLGPSGTYGPYFAYGYQAENRRRHLLQATQWDYWGEGAWRPVHITRQPQTPAHPKSARMLITRATSSGCIHTAAPAPAVRCALLVAIGHDTACPARCPWAPQGCVPWGPELTNACTCCSLHCSL